ncbi:proline-rich protein [Streptomyces zinciresistens K42]|uniref:Proline-rich protein n=1 Tax=Streptomyces zinciresistens K42 TaxID=700597 RepID=G2GG95_9ACTN|nr:SCO3374 family protein [Streptomyces zinciresistens]EGX57472.1 proline-rich protein [Streptomyces zinciresistens K42]
MVGPRPARSVDSAAIPLPRRPLDAGDQVRGWYEKELGWPVLAAAGGGPPLLRVGVRFDVLDVPAGAGRAALRHLGPHSPVAAQGDRLRLLVAAGSAVEVPGVLDWLEWGSLPLDLLPLGEGALMEAPRPPVPFSAARDGARPAPGRGPGPEGGSRRSGPPGSGAPGSGAPRPVPLGRSDAVQGAAVWLRPPEPGGGTEVSLPTLSAVGGGGGAPDLVRVLDTVATHCHRLRLRRACAQPAVCP